MGLFKTENIIWCINTLIDTNDNYDNGCNIQLFVLYTGCGGEVGFYEIVQSIVILSNIDPFLKDLR